MAGVQRIGQYVLGDTIGKGSFGKVKEAKHAITNHIVAVKILNREKVNKMKMFDKIKQEVQILRLFRHPHIIKLYQAVASPTDIFLVMEHVSGGELFDYILKKRLSESEARRFFQQIISGVDYCHQHMVVHRDLKPENLLLDNNLNVKIADFGLSSFMRDGDFLQTSCGSPNYAAPEVISGKLYAGPEVDVWSCGIILYVLLTGKMPFDDHYVPALFKKIRSGKFYIPEHLSKGAVDLLKRMIRVDPLERITIDDIRQHPWFTVDLTDDLFIHDDQPTFDFDDAAVSYISQKFQVFPEHVLEALRSGDEKNQLCVAYRLVLHNRQFEKQDANVPSELETSDVFYDSPVSSHRERRDSEETTFKLPSLPHRETKTKRMVKRSKWHLGMRSRSDPAAVMGAVYRGLQRLNFQWKLISPYHVRCRCWNQVSGTMMKMTLQLFQRDGYTFLDFKNLPTKASDRLQPLGMQVDDQEPYEESGGFHTLEFFELCALVALELGGR